MTATAMRLSLIEASRAVAALAVVLMHATHLMRVENFSGHVGLGGIFDWGYVGVDFFFVLSGFIITFVHYEELGGGAARWPSYLWKRFVRVFPIYWCVLIGTILLTVIKRLVTHAQPLMEWNFAHVPGTVFLLLGQGEPAYVGVAWSLQFEVMFYASFCIMLLHRGAGFAVYALWGAAVLTTATGILPVQEKAWSSTVLSPHCGQFLMGVVTALAARRWRIQLHPGMLALATLLFVAATAFERLNPANFHGAQGRFALGLASALLLFVMVNVERGKTLQAPRLLAQLGAVSYSLYLAHVVLINITLLALATTGLYHRLPEVVVFLIAIAAAVSGSWWIGHHVELPLVQWLRRRWAGRRARQDDLAVS